MMGWGGVKVGWWMERCVGGVHVLFVTLGL